MIIATAGHVDHGKTRLIKALTAIDTDRLPEEKQRGLSIDIGFAYADFGAAEPLGFVDVPGHERFLRNMLVGVTSIDLALLVVAADDGPMPQTFEHLAILQLLCVPACIVVLTKVDRATAEQQDQASRNITTMLKNTPFSQAQLFAVAAPMGVGIAALRSHLAAIAQAHLPRCTQGHFRMAIDRSFTLAGSGRVVTGAVLSGQVQVGDAIMLSPRGGNARVRSIRAQGQPAEHAQAGQRCALNLAGVGFKDAEPVRGDWAVAAAAHAPTARIDARLHTLTSDVKPLTQRKTLQLHIGAATLSAQVVWLGGPDIAPGGSAWVQLVLAAPIAAVHGDRFVLRDTTTQRTVGGGQVIDPFGLARGRAKPERLAQLRAMALPTPGDALAALLPLVPHGVATATFASAWNLRPDEVQALQAAQALHADQAVHCISAQATDGGLLWLAPAHWQAWRAKTLAVLAAWHQAHPDSQGPSESALMQTLGLRKHKALWRAVLESLVEDRAVQREGLCWRLPQHRPVLGAADQALFDRVTSNLRPTGLRPPIVGDLALQLDVPLPELKIFLQRAAHLGLLVRVAPNRYYLPDTIADLHTVAKLLSAESMDGHFDAATYRDRSGIGRNLSVQVLEFLDREGMTEYLAGRRRAC